MGREVQKEERGRGRAFSGVWSLVACGRSHRCVLFR